MEILYFSLIESSFERSTYPPKEREATLLFQNGPYPMEPTALAPPGEDRCNNIDQSVHRIVLLYSAIIIFVSSPGKDQRNLRSLNIMVQLMESIRLYGLDISGKFVQ